MCIAENLQVLSDSIVLFEANVSESDERKEWASLSRRAPVLCDLRDRNYKQMYIDGISVPLIKVNVLSEIADEILYIHAEKILKKISNSLVAIITGNILQQNQNKQQQMSDYDMVKQFENWCLNPLWLIFSTYFLIVGFPASFCKFRKIICKNSFLVARMTKHIRQ